MPRLLHLDSSIDPARSRSRAITAAFVEAWRGRGDDFTVTSRDLHADPVPHLTSAASHWAPRLRQPGDVPPAAESALQQELLDELLAADVLLVGAPMYNYSLPSTLKAWIDHIHVPGITAPFDTTDQPHAGPTGGRRHEPRRRLRPGDADGGVGPHGAAAPADPG